MTDKQYDILRNLIIKVFRESTTKEQINEVCDGLIEEIEYLRDQITYEEALNCDGDGECEEEILLKVEEPNNRKEK